jgi:6-phosphofructokinase 1
MDVVKMIKSQFDVSVRASVLGHIQRGGSPSAQDRLLGSLMGARAVEGLLQGETRFMTGRQAGQIVTCPIDHAWTHRIPLDPDLLRLCEVLSV